MGDTNLMLKVTALVLLAIWNIDASKVEKKDDADNEMNYYFNYNVKDKDTFNYHSRDEYNDGKKIYGSYTVMEPNGKLRIVKYMADEFGFHAIVEHEDKGKIKKENTGDGYNKSKKKTKTKTYENAKGDYDYKDEDEYKDKTKYVGKEEKKSKKVKYKNAYKKAQTNFPKKQNYKPISEYENYKNGDDEYYEQPKQNYRKPSGYKNEGKYYDTANKNSYNENQNNFRKPKVKTTISPIIEVTERPDYHYDQYDSPPAQENPPIYYEVPVNNYKKQKPVYKKPSKLTDYYPEYYQEEKPKLLRKPVHKQPLKGDIYKDYREPKYGERYKNTKPTYKPGSIENHQRKPVYKYGVPKYQDDDVYYDRPGNYEIIPMYKEQLPKKKYKNNDDYYKNHYKHYKEHYDSYGKPKKIEYKNPPSKLIEPSLDDEDYRQKTYDTPSNYYRNNEEIEYNDDSYETSKFRSAYNQYKQKYLSNIAEYPNDYHKQNYRVEKNPYIDEQPISNSKDKYKPNSYQNFAREQAINNSYKDKTTDYNGEPIYIPASDFHKSQEHYKLYGHKKQSQKYRDHTSYEPISTHTEKDRQYDKAFQGSQSYDVNNNKQTDYPMTVNQNYKDQSKQMYNLNEKSPAFYPEITTPKYDQSKHQVSEHVNLGSPIYLEDIRNLKYNPENAKENQGANIKGVIDKENQGKKFTSAVVYQAPVNREREEQFKIAKEQQIEDDEDEDEEYEESNEKVDDRKLGQNYGKKLEETENNQQLRIPLRLETPEPKRPSFKPHQWRRPTKVNEAESSDQKKAFPVKTNTSDIKRPLFKPYGKGNPLLPKRPQTFKSQTKTNQNKTDPKTPANENAKPPKQTLYKPSKYFKVKIKRPRKQDGTEINPTS